jgi:hypothetical protein
MNKARGLFAPLMNLALCVPPSDTMPKHQRPILKSIRDLAVLARARAQDVTEQVRHVRQTIDRSREH